MRMQALVPTRSVRNTTIHGLAPGADSFLLYEIPRCSWNFIGEPTGFIQRNVVAQIFATKFEVSNLNPAEGEKKPSGKETITGSEADYSPSSFGTINLIEVCIRLQEWTSRQ